MKIFKFVDIKQISGFLHILKHSTVILPTLDKIHLQYTDAETTLMWDITLENTTNNVNVLSLTAGEISFPTFHSQSECSTSMLSWWHSLTSNIEVNYVFRITKAKKN